MNEALILKVNLEWINHGHDSSKYNSHERRKLIVAFSLLRLITTTFQLNVLRLNYVTLCRWHTLGLTSWMHQAGVCIRHAPQISWCDDEYDVIMGLRVSRKNFAIKYVVSCNDTYIARFRFCNLWWKVILRWDFVFNLFTGTYMLDW